MLLPYYSHLAHHTASVQRGARAHPWKRKRSTLFWRGGTTGGQYTLQNWRNYTRSRLVQICQSPESNNFCDAAFYTYVQMDDSTRAEMRSSLRTKKAVPIAKQFRYKYLASLDGNGPCAGRLEKFLFGNSVIFKETSPHIEFYYSGMEPNVHYLPIASDMSDLSQQYRYAVSHDDEMRRIVENMQSFARVQLSFGSMACYVRELLTEYSQLLNYTLKPVTELGDHVRLLYPSYPHGGRQCRNPIYNCHHRKRGGLKDGVYAFEDKDLEHNSTRWCYEWPS